VATSLMGRKGADPRPAPRYTKKSKGYKLPQPPSFNEKDLTDKPSNMTSKAPPLTAEQIHQLKLDYQGRTGALLAVDDHVKKLVGVLRKTHQLKNTLIVFLSDNGWLQGQHRIPGDKYLPYEESLRVPLILRGPGIPKGRTVHGQVSNIDFAPTLLAAARAKPGRTMDGVSLLPTIRNPKLRPKRTLEIEALAPLFRRVLPANQWDRPYKGVRTDRYTYVVYTETGEQELYDRKTDPYQLRNVAAVPSYAAIKAELAAKLVKLNTCKGRSCNVR
jgi:arylsulfatase A-like enzyme